MSTKASGRRLANRYPASSKMLDAYLSDITQLLAEQRWHDAESAALALPSIAISLSESDGRSSRQRYGDWCRKWIDEPLSDETYDSWYQQATNKDGTLEEGVPVRALRTLRLHRLIRTGGISVGARMTVGLETEGIDASHVCRALIQATHNWYSRYALSSEVVQRQLSRLAILR